MAKWTIDPGHGGGEPGAVNQWVKEKDINLTVALEVERVLKLNGQTVQMTRRTDVGVDLMERCNMANNWGADYFVSVHHNAGGGNGMEVIHSIYHGVGEDLAQIVANVLSSGTGQNIRNVYSRRGDNGDYYAVIRATNMPAIITEFGFMDNAADYAEFDTVEELIEEGRFIAAGCLKLVGITNPNYGGAAPTTNTGNTPTPPKVMYRVIMDGTQIMALSDQSKAEETVRQRVDGGLNKSGKVQRNTDSVDLYVYPDPNKVVVQEPVKPEPTPTPVQPTPPPAPPVFEITTGVPITGPNVATAEQMATFCLKYNSNPKLLGVVDYKSMVAFCQMFLDEGTVEGIRGDIAFCQSVHETGFFAFGGQVLPEQNNYGGIGAVNNSAAGKGAWFKDPREGIRAQIQHLKGYATKNPLNNPCVDPRYSLLGSKLGCSPYWETLSGKWAVPGFNTTKYDSLEAAYKGNGTYGQTILTIFDKVKVTTPNTVPTPAPTPSQPTNTTPTTTDKRSKYFTDIPANHWSIDVFDRAYDMGIIVGDNGKVGFTEEFARIAAMLVRTLDYIDKKIVNK